MGPLAGHRVVSRLAGRSGNPRGGMPGVLIAGIQVEGAGTQYQRATHNTDLALAVAGPVADDGVVSGSGGIGLTEGPDEIATGHSIPNAVVVRIDVPRARAGTVYADLHDAGTEEVSGHRDVDPNNR